MTARMNAPRALRFAHALTADGWKRDVAITIDANGMIVSVTPDAKMGEHIAGAAIPGVANLHSHAFQRAMAGLTEIAGHADDDFWSWRELMYRFLAEITPEDAEAIATFAYMEMLEGGFTTVTEFHYLHHQPDGTAYDNPAEMTARHLTAAEATGIGMTMLPVFYAHGDFGGKPPSPGQRRFLCDINGFAQIVQSSVQWLPSERLGIAPHSLRAATPGEIRVVDTILQGGPRHIHVSEQMKEVDACLSTHGVTPIRLLSSTVELSSRWCLIHCTHATPEELQLIASAGAIAGLCPLTEANLGDGIFSGHSFAAEGGSFGIGTDSNILISLSDELRQLEQSQRLARRARNVLASRGGSTGNRIFHQALSGGASAAGLPVSGLAPGAAADIVVLDTALPEFAAARPDQFLDIWIFAMKRNAIRDVFATGKHVVADGTHINREAINKRYKEVLGRLGAL
jgi:formimidoylglutamate deiminase